MLIVLGSKLNVCILAIQFARLRPIFCVGRIRRNPGPAGSETPIILDRLSRCKFIIA